MSTALEPVAMMTTRLPAIDRRALSQAWYSALHLASPPDAGPWAHRASRSALPPPGDAACAAVPANRALPGSPAIPSRALVSRAPGQPATRPAVERRLPSPTLTRRFERIFLRHAAQRAPHPTSVSLDIGDGRVHVVVRSDGATTRVIALCAPHLRERVDRAMAHARFALAAAGTRVEMVR